MKPCVHEQGQVLCANTGSSCRQTKWSRQHSTMAIGFHSFGFLCDNTVEINSYEIKEYIHKQMFVQDSNMINMHTLLPVQYVKSNSNTGLNAIYLAGLCCCNRCCCKIEWKF
jgi:hypothetical protein